jgi:TRAP-type C4-dicarboxylate transport system permease small subunit
MRAARGGPPAACPVLHAGTSARGADVPLTHRGIFVVTTIEKWIKWLDKPIDALLWIGLIAAFAMMVHVSLDVTFRTAFNAPIEGTAEIVGGWYMVACAYLPLAWVTRTDNHIVAGVFQQIGTRWFAYYLEVIVKICMIVYMGVFTWQTYIRALQQTRGGEVWQAGGFFIPIWPSRWMLPVIGAFMIIYLVLRVVRDIARGSR